MNSLSRQALWLLAVVPAACGGGGSGPGSPAQPVTLTFSPPSYTFALDDDAPLTVSLTRSQGPFNELALGVADPTIVGLTPLSFSGSVATLSVVPIAHGSTDVTALDGSGASASFAVATATCARPPSLEAAQQIVPAPGASAVSTGIGKLYFVGYFKTGVRPGGKLHLIVGNTGTQEGGSLSPATPPPGTVLPSPIPLTGTTSAVLAASAPALIAGRSYRTQLYNDTCQPAVIAGNFST